VSCNFYFIPFTSWVASLFPFLLWLFFLLLLPSFLSIHLFYAFSCRSSAIHDFCQDIFVTHISRIKTDVSLLDVNEVWKKEPSLSYSCYAVWLAVSISLALHLIFRFNKFLLIKYSLLMTCVLYFHYNIFTGIFYEKCLKSHRNFHSRFIDFKLNPKPTSK